jgi:hypothetical protein
MQVVIQIDPESSRQLNSLLDATPAASGDTSVSPQVRDLANEARELGDLRAIHPGVDSADLQSFFVLDVPDRDSAERAIARLRQSKVVTAAYFKPPDEAP